MTIIVHHLERSRSQRILWLLEELGLAYELKLHKRDPQTHMAEPSYRQVHPLGKSPTIEDDGRVLPETGAIFEYLIEKAGGKLRPASGDERLRFTFWMHYPEGSVMPMLSARWIMNSLRMHAPEALQGPVQELVAAHDAGLVAPSLRTHMDYWESELGRSAYLAGDAFSAADIMMHSAVEAASAMGGVFDGRPKLKAWFETIRARDGFKRAQERGAFPT